MENNMEGFSPNISDAIHEHAANNNIILITNPITSFSMEKIYYPFQDMIQKEIEGCLHGGQLFLEECTPIRMFIHSPGGDVFSSLTLCNLIESSPIPIHVRVLGRIDSGATYMALCGHQREMYADSYMGLHGVAASFTESLFEEDLLNESRINKDIGGKLRNLLARHTRLSPALIEKYTNKCNELMDAEFCLKHGLIDRIIPDSEITEYKIADLHPKPKEKKSKKKKL